MFVRETGYELYHRILVGPWAQIAPDLQYTTNASTRRSNDETFVIGLRARRTF
jgi:carbohydrate-selective porin OprB